MYLKRILLSCCVMLMAGFASAPAHAARIYNFLNIPVQASGFPGLSVILQPGERSESLGWSSATILSVTTNVNGLFGPSPRPVCYFDWGLHAEVQGGNYVVIAQSGLNVRCNLCNADHQLVGRSDGRVPDGVVEHVSPYQEC